MNMSTNSPFNLDEIETFNYKKKVICLIHYMTLYLQEVRGLDNVSLVQLIPISLKEELSFNMLYHSYFNVHVDKYGIRIHNPKDKRIFKFVNNDNNTYYCKLNPNFQILTDTVYLDPFNPVHHDLNKILDYIFTDDSLRSLGDSFNLFFTIDLNTEILQKYYPNMLVYK